MRGPLQKVKGSFTTVVDLLREAANQYPDLDAYVDNGVRMSFSDWDQAADGAARLLAETGVGRSDVLCLMLPSSNDYAVAYQAGLRLGAVTTGINQRLGRAEVASIIRRCRPAVTICEDEAQPPMGAGVVLRRSELVEAGVTGRRPNRLPRLDRNDPVAIVWTSGSTGNPKGVVFDHDRLAAVAISTGVLSEPGDRRLATLAFPHVSYMTRQWDEIVNLITNVIVPQPWRAEHALRVISEERVTVGQGTPTQWALMLRHESCQSTDFSHMRLAGIGGASVPPELVVEIRRRVGCPVVVRYASTEMSSGTGTRIDDSPEVVATTVGVPNPGVEVEVVDRRNQPVAAGDVGGIRVRSAAVMNGYWNDPELTAATLDTEGWLSTGDLGAWDDQGNLRLVGRLVEMYIRGGFNVYPVEVERVLEEHPDIAQAAVVGVPAPVLGEVGVAFVVPKRGKSPDLATIRRHVQERLADYKAPDRLYVVDELPVTGMHKLDKLALGARAREVSDLPPAGPAR